jgi:hypothetical protein
VQLAPDGEVHRPAQQGGVFQFHIGVDKKHIGRNGPARPALRPTDGKPPGMTSISSLPVKDMASSCVPSVDPASARKTFVDLIWE